MSNNILNIQYDSVKKTLTVTFFSLGKYEYQNVNYSTYDDLLQSKQKTKYFNENIKGKFTESKIR
jgi:hypothetical protein